MREWIQSSSALQSGWKRAASKEKRSRVGLPSSIQAAASFPTPPPSMRPMLLKPQQWKSPRTPEGSQPTRGLWSGVKLSGPQTVDLMPVSAMSGHRCMCPSRFCPKVS